MYSLLFAFCRFLVQKTDIPSPTSSESAKYLVIISVLGEKLGLCWELQFALKDAKI